ncbi:MAG: hypothetical protein C5B58_06335 [Acidobacteria bacterium]|nr:MAG: hypothetical protein C5B58_06335 [Acidobacteriota bacterium]
MNRAGGIAMTISEYWLGVGVRSVSVGALVLGALPGLAEPVKWSGASIIDAVSYGVIPGAQHDQSMALQAALDAAGSAGGGTVRLAPGSVYAHGLSLPAKVCIEGAGSLGATVLKLTNGSNTFLLASAAYVQDSPYSTLGGCLRNMTLDGNKANNPSGSLFILEAYRFSAEHVDFNNSAANGVLFIDESLHGVANVNNLAEVYFWHVAFDHNSGAGFYGNSRHGRLSDGWITDSVVNANGTGQICNIHIERAAGFHITNNQTYAAPSCELYLAGTGATVINNNNFDGTANTATSGPVRTAQVILGGWGNATIVGNIFHTQAKGLGGASGWNLLEISGAPGFTGEIAFSGNSFHSVSIPVEAISIPASPEQAGIRLLAGGNIFGSNSAPPVNLPGLR